VGPQSQYVEAAAKVYSGIEDPRNPVGVPRANAVKHNETL
jgi:hypothetical protein